MVVVRIQGNARALVWKKAHCGCGPRLPLAAHLEQAPFPARLCHEIMGRGEVGYGRLALSVHPSFFSPAHAPAGHRRVYPLSPLLWLHGPHGLVLLAPHGHHRLLCSLHVCPQDLRCCEDRLMGVDHSHAHSVHGQEATLRGELQALKIK